MTTRAVGILVLPMLVAAGCGAARNVNNHASDQRQTLPGLTQEKIELIRAAAIRDAAEMGEEHPTDGFILATTQHHFYEMTDPGTTTGRPDFDAFVVSYKGDFVDERAPRPEGAEAPRGHTVYAIYKADDLTLAGHLTLTDFGLGDRDFHPGAIGRWIPLDLSEG